MTTYESQDRITGEWADPKSGNVHPVSFKKVFRGHTWTKQETEDLLAGKKLTLELTSKKGFKYTLDNVCLDHRSFIDPNGKEVKGIWVDGEIKQTIPDEFCKHVFTDEEKEALNNGQTVHVDGMVSSKGNEFSADLKWGKYEYQGKERTGIHFADN